MIVYEVEIRTASGDEIKTFMCTREDVSERVVEELKDTRDLMLTITPLELEDGSPI